jgi:hypothetical protein
MLKYIIAKGADVNARVWQDHSKACEDSVHEIIDMRFKTAMRNFYHQSGLSYA